VVTADVAHAVTKMMVQTCEMGSAAKSFRGHKIRVAGKTGPLTRNEPFFMEHSWFVGYAPVEKPTLVVSVVLGNPENWHLRGQDAARRLIDQALGATRREKDRAAKITSQRDKRNQW
jgi:cell division protein FtsI/penicillin-binding protein 2